ncbi:hypothetical protein [Brevibacterium album]|uniref:hypothetical protein n=1 Tax=Brevibacterium album TaxID=417948 RepID=UPI00048A56C0|nr:hypothetical protein [Brevibacterium album]
MTYAPQEWRDGDPETPLSGSRLSHLEQGVAGAHEAVASAAMTATWGQVANRPSRYNPTDHTHAIADITGLQAELERLQSEIDALKPEG